MPMIGEWKMVSYLPEPSAGSSPRSQNTRDFSAVCPCFRHEDSVCFDQESSCQEEKHSQDAVNGEPLRTLTVEYWGRTDECLEQKWAHMEMVDRLFASRKELILATTLYHDETVLEPNMFPYDTPERIEHWTLWSRHEMNHAEIEAFVCCWLKRNAPQVGRWNYDENMSRSIDIFHVHVYLEVTEVRCLKQ